MTWYFVVLIAIGYIIMWIITTVIMANGDNDPEWVFVVFFWPAVIALLPIIMSGFLVEKILNVLSKEDKQ